MSAPDAPQLYLVTPPAFETETFLPQLSRVLDAEAVACLRLDLAGRDEDRLMRAAGVDYTMCDCPQTVSITEPLFGKVNAWIMARAARRLVR